MPSSIPDLRECIPECRECIKSYIKKHKLEKGDLKFEIPCRGIKENPLDEYILSGLEDPEEAVALLDPVAWAKKNLDWICVDPNGEQWKRKTDVGTLPAGFPLWNPKDARRGRSPFHRPYQSLMLRCTSRRKVSRCGRQLGKCLVSGTLIHLADGTLKPIEELKGKINILSMDDDYHIVPSLAEVSYNGEKEVLKLTLRDGRSIECSLNHPFLARKKKSVRGVLEDDWYQADELELGDHIAAPRWSHEGKESPSTEEYEENDVIFLPIKDIQLTGEKPTWDLHVPQYHNFIANNIISHNTDCLAVSICYDIFTHKDFSVTLITPYQTQVELIFKRVLELIKVNPELYNSIKEKRKSPNFYLELYNGSTVQGYSCVAGTKITTRDGLKNIEDIIAGDEVLSLDEESNTLKYQKVAFVYEPNYKRVYKVELNCGYEVIVSKDHPFWVQSPREEKWKLQRYQWKKLKDIQVGNKVAVVHDEENISFSKIKAITYMGEDTTYDLKVGDGTNNFIANNIILHNTAGTKSNSGAGVVRGAHAQKLIFDEADMLSRADLDSSLALITNFPEAVVWLSSTPTGKRETFFKACQDTEYKEFYYPSSANPNFTEELDRYFRKNLTELGYVHEILGLFGEDSQGVYQKRYIEVAKMPYKYGDFVPQPGWIYSMGVDWNDVSGTVIRVVGLCPGDNSFYCVDRKLIKKEGWTQTAAVAEIVNVNRFWHPAWIYVDKGYGHAQVELLHGIGAQAMRNKQGKGPDARLAKIVKAYDFGSTVEIKDLFTKKPIKKPAKPFLVESSVRCFEDGRIKFPKDDANLIAALEGYYIVRLTESGTPKYGFLDAAVGDHDVDALNLALVAFALESGDFAKPSYISSIDFTGYFGEDLIESMERADRERKTQQIKEDEGGRTVYHYKSPLLFSLGGGLPAANTAKGKQVNINKLWSWPGYLRDKPPPKRKPGGFLDRLRKGGRRGGKPSRTNI